jgi:hypothetical protein
MKQGSAGLLITGYTKTEGTCEGIWLDWSLDFLYFYYFSMVRPRETREGWPRLTIETEKNGDSKSTKQRGPSLVGSLGLSCRYRRFCSALTALVG